MKLSQEHLDIIIYLAGETIEKKDSERSWLHNKDEENIKQGIMTRRTAISAYTQLRKDY